MSFVSDTKIVVVKIPEFCTVRGGEVYLGDMPIGIVYPLNKEFMECFSSTCMVFYG